MGLPALVFASYIACLMPEVCTYVDDITSFLTCSTVERKADGIQVYTHVRILRFNLATNQRSTKAD